MSGLKQKLAKAFIAAGLFGSGFFVGLTEPQEETVLLADNTRQTNNGPKPSFDKTTVYASGETTTAYQNQIKILPDIIRGSVARVLVISSDDLTKDNPVLKEYVEKAKASQRGEITWASAEDFYKKNDVANLATTTLRQYLDKHYPDVGSALEDEIMKSTAEYIIKGFASSIDISTNLESSESDTAIITTGYPHTPKLLQASGLSGLPLGAFSKPADIPGTDEKWDTGTFIHEGTHILNKTLRGLRGEFAADKGLESTIPAMESGGLYPKSRFVEYLKSLRDIGAFFSGEDHATGAAFNVRAQGHKNVSANGLTDGLKNAKDIITSGIGSDGISTTAEINRYDSFIKGLEHVDGKGVVDLKPGELKIIEGIIKILVKMQTKNLDESALVKLFEEKNVLYKTLSQDTQDKIAAIEQQEQKNWGAMLMQHMPEEFFATAAKMYDEGKFDDNPLGKVYVYNFLTAAQKYFKEYFDADPKRVFTPPSPKEKQAAMVLPFRPSSQDPDGLALRPV